MTTASGASRSWLRRRVAIAIALTVSFYALALTICLGLLWIAYAEVTYTSHLISRLVQVHVLGVGSICSRLRHVSIDSIRTVVA